MARVLFAPLAVTVFLFSFTSATFSHDAPYSSGGGYGGGAFHGPVAAPVVLASGYLADTGDVAAAKSAHYSTLLSAKANSGYGYDGGYGGGNGGGSGYGSGYGGYGGGAYHGPLAAPVVLSSGYLADTKEVADAKNAHYTALLSAKASSDYGSGYGGSYGGYGGGYGSGASYGGGAYHGPLPAPVVLTSGFLADTRDVAAAKDAHYVALSEASSRAYGGGYYGKH